MSFPTVIITIRIQKKRPEKHPSSVIEKNWLSSALGKDYFSFLILTRDKQILGYAISYAPGFTYTLANQTKPNQK